MGRKRVVFAFYDEEVEKLKKHYEIHERQLGEDFEYHQIVHLEEVMELMEDNRFRDVFISSVKVFDDLHDFWWFSEVVIGNGANYYIEKEGINSEEMYPVGAILAKIGNCFNKY